MHNSSRSSVRLDGLRLPGAQRSPGKHEVHSDCDDEGLPPPRAGFFMDPTLMSDIAAPPPRGAVELKLPFFKSAERVRYRGQYESRILYEDWTEYANGEDRFAGGSRSRRREVKKLEDDSDFPIGRPFFWKAFCGSCNVSYYPHVPTMWGCPRCKAKVWQQPTDPESKACASCSRKVAAIILVGARKIRNPMALNAHQCKRCGRVVCDQCYSPVPLKLEELGFATPQRTCVQCVNDLKEQERGAPPVEEDMGTLHDEDALGAIDEAQYLKPFWPPQCRGCGTTYGQPPSRWACPTCAALTWQPTDVPESANCFICNEKFPKTRCHKCGQLACAACGAYAQPLPQLGFDDGKLLSVCKCCYDGVTCSALVDPAIEQIKREVEERAFKGQCPVCNQRFTGQPPAEWQSKCHKRPCWQPDSKSCAVRTLPLSEELREHCAMCGWIVCVTCAQYRQPVVERGFPKGTPQVVCRACYNPRKAMLPDHNDLSFWPPRCPVCTKQWDTPPDRWRCTHQCGTVWQPIHHVASQACCCCGKKTATAQGASNCRMCGRIACATCLTKAEVLEMGFTRGMLYPRCKWCTVGKGAGGGGGGVLAASAGSAISVARPAGGGGTSSGQQQQQQQPVAAAAPARTPTPKSGASSPQRGASPPHRAPVKKGPPGNAARSSPRR